ncbi:unnamed protein product [Effrenium voratum]|nr:unnamed protein product [Effrenium voratum]
MSRVGRVGRVVLLDGGMGRELLNRGVPQEAGLWSATSVAREQYHPEVVQLHLDFLRAGSRVLTTNNYACQPTYYQAAFESGWEEKLLEHTAHAVRLCQEAVRQFCAEDGVPREEVTILGCLPPLIESHRPDLVVGLGESWLSSWYQRLAAQLLQGGVDGLLAETMNTMQEARSAFDGAKAAAQSCGRREVPFWLALQGSLRCPETMRAQAQAAREMRIVEQLRDLAGDADLKLEVFLLNCARPREILAVLQALEKDLQNLQEDHGVKLGAYANLCEDSGQEFLDADGESDRSRSPKKRLSKYDRRESRKFLGTHQRLEEDFVDDTLAMIRLGCSYVGGCCGCPPQLIRKVAVQLE